MSELKKIRDALKAIVIATSSRETMKEVAEYLVEEIPRRTRAGLGVSGKGKPAKNFKKLAPITVENRKEDPALSSKTTPSTSNLTHTGKMVDSINYKATTGKAIVKLQKPQATKAKKNIELGRRFMEVSDKDLDKITDIIGKNIEAEINKLK